MGLTTTTKIILKFLGDLQERDEPLTRKQMRLLLEGLATCGHFSEAAEACLRTASVVAGDLDEILPEVLKQYRCERLKRLADSAGESDS